MLLNSGILFLCSGFYSLQCLPLCPLCTLTPAIPNESIPTLPYLNQPPNESQLNQPPPPPTLIIPEPDQRVGRGFKWMGVCWFRCDGQLTQVGRGDSARGSQKAKLGEGCSSVRGGRVKRLNGGCMGAKIQVLRGKVNKIFLQFDFRSRKGVGRTLTLQRFCIAHLLNAETLAIFWTTRNKNKMKKKSF